MFGTGILERTIEGKKLKIDGRKAVLSAEVPEEEIHEDYFKREEIIYTNPAQLFQNKSILPSLSVIRFAKIKNFIDGVYATIEERIAEKGHRLSREDLLKTLESRLEGLAKAYITSARNRSINEPSISLPQGFYDWTPELREAYSQIKILSRRPGLLIGEEENDQLNEITIDIIKKYIKNIPGLEKAYTRILELYEKTTNEYQQDFVLFPSAKLPDQEFFKQFSSETQSDIPEGLGKALVEAVRSGRVDFTPSANSGLYIRQMFEIVPLISRETPEFNKYKPNDTYKKILENEFISQWAGTRHTHVGHTAFEDIMMVSCLSHDEPIIIEPELKLEPFATSYERMLSSLEFFNETIKTLLPEILERKRIMNNGDRTDIKIGEEFESMKLLLQGLSYISKDTIHLPYDGNPKPAIKKASNWLRNISSDKDINRKMPIFVPIIRTTDGSRQVSYVDVGFKTIDLTLRYEKIPEIIQEEKPVNSGYQRYEYQRFVFGSNNYQFPVLVHRELRIPYSRLINDRKLQDMLPDSFPESDLDKILSKLER